MNHDLTRRTPAEELWLWRARRRLTQSRAAALLGVGRTTLSVAENGGPARFRLPRPVRPGYPDLLALARRRYGTGLRATARLARMSHVTLLARERAADPRLIAFWEGIGFVFRA